MNRLREGQSSDSHWLLHSPYSMRDDQPCGFGYRHCGWLHCVFGSVSSSSWSTGSPRWARHNVSSLLLSEQNVYVGDPLLVWNISTGAFAAQFDTNVMSSVNSCPAYLSVSSSAALVFTVSLHSVTPLSLFPLSLVFFGPLFIGQFSSTPLFYSSMSSPLCETGQFSIKVLWSAACWTRARPSCGTIQTYSDRLTKTGHCTSTSPHASTASMW